MHDKYDDERAQQEDYEYWAQRDLENLLSKDWVRQEIEEGQKSLELEDA